MSDRVQIAEHIKQVAARIAGSRLPVEEAHLMVGDLQIAGFDGIDLLEEIEQRWRVDLRPYMDRRTTRRKGWFGSRPVVSDTTIAELIDEVATLVDNPPARA